MSATNTESILLLPSERVAEVADNLLSAKELRDLHAILKKHHNYGTIVLSQVGLNLLAHSNAQATVIADFKEQVTAELSKMLPPAADKLANYDAPIVKEMSRMYTEFITQAASRLGIDLSTDLPPSSK